MKILTAALLSASLTGLMACSGANDSKAVDAAKDTANAAQAKAADTMNEAKAMTKSTSAVEAERWLAVNAARPDVVSLPSGLQYTVNTASKTPGNSPAPGQMVKVHYEGKLIDGTVFDSSYERGEPARFPSDRLIKGWVQALGMMSPGDEWTLYLPPELAYGERGTRGIPGNSVLIFRMELIENL